MADSDGVLMQSVWSTEASRAAIADARLEAPEPEPPTWRTDLYWIVLVEPTPEEQARRRALWAQCRRCGVRENVLLPADLGDVANRLREIAAAHVRCPQTLLGARWELLVTLRRRGALKAEVL
jgi:hypothetical protein